MSIELELVTYLKAHAALVAVLGIEKVFLSQAPQGTEFDYVVVHKITGGRINRVGFGAPLFQVSYFSRSALRAHAGADILVAALDGYQGTWGGTLRVSGDYREDRVLVEEGVFHAPVEIRVNYLEV